MGGSGDSGDGLTKRIAPDGETRLASAKARAPHYCKSAGTVPSVSGQSGPVPEPLLLRLSRSLAPLSTSRAQNNGGAGGGR